MAQPKAVVNDHEQRQLHKACAEREQRGEVMPGWRRKNWIKYLYETADAWEPRHPKWADELRAWAMKCEANE